MPRMKKAEDFWAYSKAGRQLGDFHVEYESVDEYSAQVDVAAKAPADSVSRFRVEKMKFGKGTEKAKDKSVVHYNGFITVRGIPLEAYDYVVNGKPAIEWVMERQSVTTDKASGIVKDANDWANETVGDPRYPLSLLLRVITVSLETMKIVRSLPALDIYEEPSEPTAKLLPFRRVEPKPEERYRDCVPLVGLSAAAGKWSDWQEAVPELDDPSIEWVTWDDPPHIAKGMFVAQVQGRSMEPRIPDGAYCLFRRVSQPTSSSSPVLVRHASVADFETGGEFTVKLYREEGTGEAKRVVLQPENPEFEPLVITPEKASDVRIIAELVQVL